MQVAKELEYLNILKALEEIPFGVGRALLVEFIQGNITNYSVRKNNLSRLISFGSMELYEKHEIEEVIDELIFNGMIEQKPLPDKLFVKVLALSDRGRAELSAPTISIKSHSAKLSNLSAKITEQDRSIFRHFDFFLGEYNEEQKKAIICPAEKILCIAGAGSGKTTVLTKRIEFLVKFRSVNPEKILAITFTRKARQQMIIKLSGGLCDRVSVETFNSFSEKMLTRYNDMLYTKKMRLINYSEKIRMMNLALSSLNLSLSSAIDTYFSSSEKKGKTTDELVRIFANDCFFVLDYCKNYNKNIEDVFSIERITGSDRLMAEIVYRVCLKIQESMAELGMRDYSDQLVECLRLFRKYKETVPNYEHVLVDEYQDINHVQAELIGILPPKNIFCVGDPRQSIFGWRGSKISYILEFQDNHLSCEVIPLSKNYRSSLEIVTLMNSIIEPMHLPPIESTINEGGDIRIIEFESEDAEMEFVIQSLLHKKDEFGRIFVLARTNRTILELSDRMKVSSIKHVVKTDEIRRYLQDEEANITLATVHSIKGMEADTVFVVGCTPNNFPCRASEHPVIELIKIDNYDKEEEERRLFYVAVSRAKKRLYLTYAKSLTWFISKKQKLTASISKPNGDMPSYENSGSNNAITELKKWRSMIASENSIPAYIVMHDKTLIEIATLKPQCIEDLENIYGLGPTKIKKYGQEILRIVTGMP